MLPLLLGLSLGCIVQGEFFTSTDNFRFVLDAESKLASALLDYVSTEEKRLDGLKAIAKDLRDHSGAALSDLSEFIANPLNTYLLARRFVKDFKNLENYFENAESTSKLRESFESHKASLPTKEDYEGAVGGLLRLQDTYAVQTHVLTEGKLPGVNKTVSLTSHDCLEIGKVAYHKNEWRRSQIWLKQALNLSQTADEYNSAIESKPVEVQALYDNHLSKDDLADLLDYLSFSLYMTNDMAQALAYTNQLANLRPDNRVEKNLIYFDYYLKNPDENPFNKGELSVDMSDSESERFGSINAREDNPNAAKSTQKGESEYQNYERLCRGEKIKELKDAHLLECQFADHGRDPRLILAPLKVEVVHRDPWIYRFHDVIEDYEIEAIKKLAYARLSRATVQNAKTGVTEHANYRITKSGWLGNETDTVIIPGINRKISSYTNINLEQAEELQVANYGIGGHYEPHFDFSRREEKEFEKSKGNRVATLLFYMSDVHSGGATVFPELGLSIFPEKGSAAFWFNLYKSGEGDLTLRHAACPVYVGNKWVSNKWYHERSNELWWPCGLDKMERYSLEDWSRPTRHRRMGRSQFSPPSEYPNYVY